MIKLLEQIGARAVVDDSRAAGKDTVFVWDSRIGGKGEEFIASALKAGAMVVSDVRGAGVTFCENPGELLAQWAAKAYPKQPQVMLGVTGTSGKTSVAWFARQLMQACKVKAASIGTLGVMRSNEDVETEYTGFTSPTALRLHPILQTLAQEKITHAVMEVSSHALVLNRADGVKFKAGGITNITQDHLDFHKTWDEYAAAKLRLFSEVLPEGAVAVVNVLRKECWPAMAVAKQRGLHVLSVGSSNAELVVEVVEASGKGLQLKLKFDAVPVEMNVPLVGGFQAENLAMALGLCVGAGLPWKDLAAGVKAITSVPGRMEMVAPGVVVDYAHKPDALQRVLESLRPLVRGKGKLRVMFGCGGNRDATKRPIMGKIAAELADVVVVTDDNPRMEKAADIRKEVLGGVKQAGGKAEEIGDRRKAIESILAGAGPDDVVLLAGKGHEQGQIVGKEVLPFDDRVVVREVLK